MTSAPAGMPEGDGEEVIVAGPVRICPERFLATLDGHALELTNKEFQLLTLLARHPGRVLRRAQIAAHVWGGTARGRTIDIHISRLRRHLPPGAIETVIRVGYRFILS